MRTGSAAVAFALKEHKTPSRVWVSEKGNGVCLEFTRTCLGVGPRFGSAIIAWSHVPKDERHGGANPPPGVPVFWQIGAFGHVAISAGGGYVWSTDILRKGQVDKVRIGFITQHWNATYLGWAESVNGVRVDDGKARIPKQTVVHISHIAEAAEHDPATRAAKGLHRAEVLVVEKALVAEGLLDDRFEDGSFGTRTVRAWKRWQRRLGRTPNGRPGREGLEQLAARHHFPVAP